jgi:hypothetical protein
LDGIVSIYPPRYNFDHYHETSTVRSIVDQITFGLFGILCQVRNK